MSIKESYSKLVEGREWLTAVLLFFVLPIIFGCIGVIILHIKEKISYRKYNTCKHGIAYPQKLKKGVWRCQECYKEYMITVHEKEKAEKEKQEAKLQEERLIREREEYKKEYCKTAKKVRAKLCNAMLTTISGIRRLDPYQFEDFCAYVYRKHGYDVKQTPKSNDGGKDAIATKDGKKIVIECKHYASDSTIGRPFLQKFYAAIVEEKANEGHFIATCSFTKEAMEFAKKFKIKLIDLEALSYLAGIQTNNEIVFNFSVPCLECGSMVSFKSVGDVDGKKCPNGHYVNNPTIDPMEPRCPLCDSKLKYIEMKTYYSNYYSRRRTSPQIIKQYRCSSYPNCRYEMSINEYNREKALLMDGKC